jgi:uncharacterized protein YcgL (UPF0745 family)
MKCTVISSDKKDFTYIYLRDGYEFEDLPVSLRNVFGEYSEVLTLDLTADRKLAYENAEMVIQNLTDQGYHLQMPPTDDPTGLLDLPEKKETLL